MKRVLLAKQLITPEKVLHDAALVYENETIVAVGSRNTIIIPPDAEVTDYGDAWISPGFIDIHIHGCKGGSVDDTSEDVKILSDYVAPSGCTAICPGIGTTDLKRALTNIADAIDRQKQAPLTGAEIIGIHMEGPFWAPKKLDLGFKTATVDNCIAPTKELIDEAIRLSRGNLKRMDFGLEWDHVYEMIAYARSKGILCSVAHTKKGYDDLQRANEVGITHGTHLFNVMTGLHHRRPGIVGGLLTNDNMTTEVICDGLHLHPAAIDVAIRCKGPDRLAMITDLCVGGLPDGEYGDRIIKDGVCRLKGTTPDQDNTIAGSTKRIDTGIRTVLGLGHPMQTAVRMASLTPATIIGVADRKGSLRTGKDADIAVFTDRVEILETIVRGTTVYKV